MKLFVTGATGFIGAHFVNAALEHRYQVTAQCRPGSKPRIPITKPPTWLEGRLDDDWSKELSDCSALVHLAAAGVNPALTDWDELFQVNVLQSLTLWRTAADAGVKRFLILGSCFEYGKSGERFEFLSTDAPLEPSSAYAASKAAATMAALAFAVEQKVELLVIRPFHVFGEGEAATRFWPALQKAALGGDDFPMSLGEQIRDFVPVEVVARTLCSSLTRNDLRAGEPRIENLGSGSPLSLRAFAEAWWQKWGATGKLKPGTLTYRENEVMRYIPKV